MRGKGLFFPRVPEVTPAHIRAMTEGADSMTQRAGVSSSRSGSSRGFSAADFDADPQAYIDKAVKKYAGNTFILPDEANPDA